MLGFSYVDSLRGKLRVNKGGSQRHVDAVCTLYSKLQKSICSYSASLEPYENVQGRLNDRLNKCKDKEEVERIKKHMARNALFMLQCHNHIEQGHRYGFDDEDCEHYGISRNVNDTAYSSFPIGYTGYSYDDFMIEEARENPLLKSLKCSSIETIQNNVDQISAHNKAIFDRVKGSRLKSVHGNLEIHSDDIRIGSLRPLIAQLTPTTYMFDQKVSVPEWDSRQYELFFADEATAQEISFSATPGYVVKTPAHCDLKEKLSKVSSGVEKKRKGKEGRVDVGNCSEKRARGQADDKAKPKRRRIIDDDDSD